MICSWPSPLACVLFLAALAVAIPISASAEPAVPKVRPSPAATGPGSAMPGPGSILGAEDRALLVSALAQAERGRWADVAEAKARLEDATAAKILTWLAFQDRNSGASYQAIASFVASNPDWPRSGRLIRRAEEAFLDGEPDDAQALVWFDLNPPVTGEGKIRFGDALIAAGDTARGQDMIRRGWIEHDFRSAREAEIVRRYAGTLRHADHVQRLDRLLWDRDATDARAMARVVGAEYAALAEARIRLVERAPGVDTAVAAVPARLIDDPGLMLDRARWRRRAGLENEALPLILKVPPSAEAMVRPEEFWTERKLHARRLLKTGDYRTAYELVRHHGMSDGVDFAEGEWLAGWIALRFLNNPTEAYFHFRTLLNGVSTPISKARAAYWAARAAEADGRIQDAAFYYESASEFDTTYYGQLARESLLGSDKKLVLAAPPREAPRDFGTASAVAAMKILDSVGEDRLVTSFFYRLAEYFESPGDLSAMADWLVEAGRPNLAIRTANIAAQRGIELPHHAYPVGALPDVGSAGLPVERALVFGISRQESEFNPQAVSRAGARGLMQVMPATARQTARMHALAYDRNRLLTDPAYNTLIGSTHLGDLLDTYGGSYILAIAAYNAGPSNVREWIATYGDPRSPGIDPIDWVEQIPFAETRNYVQRVLENTQVYRTRLAGQPMPVDLVRDLHRAGIVPPAPPAAVPLPSAAPAGE